MMRRLALLCALLCLPLTAYAADAPYQVHINGAQMEDNAATGTVLSGSRVPVVGTDHVYTVFQLPHDVTNSRCVALHFPLAETYVVTDQIDLALSFSTSGTDATPIPITTALHCADPGEVYGVPAFNFGSGSYSLLPSTTANALKIQTFRDDVQFDETGCQALSNVYFRICRTNGGANTSTVNLISATFQYPCTGTPGTACTTP